MLFASLAAVVLGLGSVRSASAMDPIDSANRLDHTFTDVALLEPAGPDGAPRLLVVDDASRDPGLIHLSILERDRSWLELGTLEVGREVGSGREPAVDPWLVPLAPTRFALIAPTPDIGTTTVILLQTDAGQGGDDLAEVERTEIPGVVSSGGAADVDADGIPELVVGSPQACDGSVLWVLQQDTFAGGPMRLSVEGRAIIGAVVGRWDQVPGDDLLTYTSEPCMVPDPDTTPSVFLEAIRLADGTSIVGGLDVLAPEVTFLGSPLLIDLDAGAAGAAPLDEAVIRGATGLAVIDPSDDWRLTTISRGDTIPLGVTSLPSNDSPALVYIDFEQDSVAARSTLGRAADGSPAIISRDDLPVQAQGQTPDRLRRLAAQAALGVMYGRPGVVWQGRIAQDDCPDVLIQGARIRCAESAFESGAAWLGTRPLVAIGEGPSRRLLVAAGMASDPQIGLPIVPTPAATDVPGWWRAGPSAPFALAEVRAGDALYYQEFPEPRSSVERVSNPDATTALPGFTGARLLVRADATVTGQEPPRDLAVEEVFGGDGQAGELRAIVRIPVPPGLDSGRDGAAVLVPLAEATLPDGTAGSQWTMQVVPINDWGEVGPMAVGLVQRDSTGPTLVVGEPFTTPVWPLPAKLTGSAEPGSTVVVDGVGEAPLDRRGGFEFQTTLAPWPQTIRITATDASGNQTVREISIIGGVDYRRFPWTVIAAVAIVIAVGASGFRGVRRRPVAAGLAGSGGGTVTLIEEWPMAELEELEPGAGLPRGGGEGHPSR